MQRNHPVHGGSGSSAAEAVSRFDVIIDRRNSDSIKYAPSQNSGKPENLLPPLGSRYGFPCAGTGY